MNEAYRILKPKGKFIVSIAFLEPFHGNSFYQNIHIGLLNCFEHAGLNVEHISPQSKGRTRTTQASINEPVSKNATYDLSKTLVAALLRLHKTWWRIGKHFNPKADEPTRLLWTAGSFMFIVSKT
jgi:hypothetical protein